MLPSIIIIHCIGRLDDAFLQSYNPHCESVSDETLSKSVQGVHPEAVYVLKARLQDMYWLGVVSHYDVTIAAKCQGAGMKCTVSVHVFPLVRIHHSFVFCGAIAQEVGAPVKLPARPQDVPPPATINPDDPMSTACYVIPPGGLKLS